MKIFTASIKRLIVPAIVILLGAMPCKAAAGNSDPGNVVGNIENLPRQEALTAFATVLDNACGKGGKYYKNFTAALEEMLSEPTWDTHNEELFAMLIKHEASASCLNDKEKLRPQLLLESVNKNAPGSSAANISYELTSSERHNLDEATTPFTLIYFNDPECLACFKVKERLDTATVLREMVREKTLTIVGIYPYDNIDAWKTEPFPDYIINGRDYNLDVDQRETYEIMTMPTFYLLDRRHRVILKNEASLNRIIKTLQLIGNMGNEDIETLLNATFNNRIK